MKISKIVTASAFAAMAVVAAGCSKGTSSSALTMWTQFGESTDKPILDEIIAKTNSVTSGAITVTHESKGSYDSLFTAIDGARTQGGLPNLANGYPDHFASYIGNDILVPLNKYVEAYDAANGTNYETDYYEYYRKENETITYTKSGGRVIWGIPFNKSTEVMTGNGYLLDFIKTVAPKYADLKIPETWQYLRDNGQRYIDALTDANVFAATSKYLIAKVDDATKTATEFEVTDTLPGESSEKVVVQNLEGLTKVSDFTVLGYNDNANLFTTMCHQWGAGYLEYDKDIYQANNACGYAVFWDSDNKTTTKGALEFMQDLGTRKILGTPQGIDAGENFCTKAFKAAKCLFTIGSSAGIGSSQSSSDPYKRIDVAPIPYNADKPDNKYVISQGTSLGIFEQGDDAAKQAAFNLIMDLTRGEIQGEWCAKSGYFPVGEKQVNSQAYQKMVTKANPTFKERLLQQGAELDKTYRTSGWEKFVDPGFNGSANIRGKLNTVFDKILHGAGDDADITKVMDTVWSSIGANNKKAGK